MAGSGTAHLRPADEVLLQVTDLVVEFPAGKGRTVNRTATSLGDSSAPGAAMRTVDA